VPDVVLRVVVSPGRVTLCHLTSQQPRQRHVITLITAQPTAQPTSRQCLLIREDYSPQLALVLAQQQRVLDEGGLF
jgi:hypothetical protein